MLRVNPEWLPTPHMGNRRVDSQGGMIFNGLGNYYSIQRCLGLKMIKKRLLFEGAFEEDEQVFFSGDDGDAAFWDEFLSREEESEAAESDEGFTVEVMDEEMGEMRVYEGVKLCSSEPVRMD